MSEKEERVIQIIFNWINLGYTRESCIRMLKTQGYNKKQIIKVVNEAFSRLSEAYDGYC